MITTVKDVNDFIAKHDAVKAVDCHGADETKVSGKGSNWIISIEFVDGFSLLLDWSIEFPGVLFSSSEG